MLLGSDMKMYGPFAAEAAAVSGQGRYLRRMGHWFPLVFPWSGLHRMTGIVTSAAGSTMVRGRLDNRFFNPEKSIHQPADHSGPTVTGLGLRPGEPACICLPRNQTLVRHFRVPTRSETEIEAMIPHLLAAELPMGLEHFSWVWALLPSPDEESALVAVHVAKNDRLEEFLGPLSTANLNVVGLIPEGWSWAHAMSQFGHEPDNRAHSIVIRGEDAPLLLVVAQAGQLLFDLELPHAACPAPAESGQGNPADKWAVKWEGPEFAAARSAFQDTLGFALPEPDIWPDALSDTDEIEQQEFCFAASVAAAGLGHDRLLLPPDRVHRSRRQTALGTLTGLGRLGAFVVVIWLGLLAYESSQTHQYLATLQQQLTTEALRVENLQMEYDAIREDSRKQTGNTEILLVMDSLRRHVKAPVHLAHLNYVQDSGVTLRGVAPAGSHVLAMMDELATDPLWQGLRVVQLRSEKVRGADQTQFVVEGHLKPRERDGLK